MTSKQRLNAVAILFTLCLFAAATASAGDTQTCDKPAEGEELLMPDCASEVECALHYLDLFGGAGDSVSALTLCTKCKDDEWGSYVRYCCTITDTQTARAVLVCRQEGCRRPDDVLK